MSDSYFGENSKHIFAGTCAGSVAKVAEYPLDTIKVRVQAHPEAYSGYADCTRKLWHAEGVRGLYRGLSAPVAGAGAENAVCFLGFSLGLRAFDRCFGPFPDIEADPPIQATIAAGAVAGFVTAFVLTPVELLKVTMQVEHTKPVEKRQYTGVLDVAQKRFRAGGIAALFEGHTATLLRETPGNAAWFGFYNLALYAQIKKGGHKRDLKPWQIALAGGCGGVMYWTAFFPADVVKTRMQLDKSFAAKGFAAGFGTIHRQYGVRGLYAGWSITAGRAFPSNAIIFTVYEYVTQWWDASPPSPPSPPPMSHS